MVERCNIKNVGIKNHAEEIKAPVIYASPQLHFKWRVI